MKRVIIVHGYTGHPDKNWFPWLKAELEKINVSVSVPSMPNAGTPKLDEWLPYLQNVVGNANEETFLVGHSLGCPTILRYLESMGDNEKVGGVLLVAGFAEPLPHLPELDSFTKGSWDDQKVIQHTNEIAIINSDDDEAVPLLYGEHVRARFNAELFTVHNKGHINEKAGIREVPFILERLKAMLVNSSSPSQ